MLPSHDDERMTAYVVAVGELLPAEQRASVI
jgi:hypothetical protein